MRSKEIFNTEDRTEYKADIRTTDREGKLYNALMIAEAEIEELKEKLHVANVEISSFTDLRPEN